MKEIILTQGKVALVDDDDYEYLNQWKWCANKARNTYYAFRSMKINGKWAVGTMHQFMMNQPKGMQVDHKDDNGLNNQRGNLRICTNQENHMKMKPADAIRGRPKSSLHKGVCFCKQTGRWSASIKMNGKVKWLGRHIHEIDAAIAYNEAAKKMFGVFARCNAIKAISCGYTQ